MTREEIARKIHWPFIVWTFGILNVIAMLPQVFQIIHTRNVEGLSLETFSIYLVLQVAFSLEGYFTRNKMFMICMGLSAMVSVAIIILIVYLRYFVV